MDINTDYWYKNKWQNIELQGLNPVVDITANDQEPEEDIQEALAAMQTQQVQKQQEAAGAQSEGQNGTPPWSNLLSELGLSPQGSKEADMLAISQAISTKASQATSEEEKAKVQSLMSDFSQYNSSNISASLGDMETRDGGLEAKADTNTGDFSGQNQLADLNKFFLVKKFNPQFS